MHFTGAVQAGEELYKGIGTAGFEYASDLIGGEWQMLEIYYKLHSPFPTLLIDTIPPSERALGVV